jgi:hypothetical protein
MADRVDASVQLMQPTGSNATLDRIPSQAKLEQLASRHHPMLRLRQLGNLPIQRSMSLRWGAMETPKRRLDRHGAMVPPSALRVVRSV